MSAAADARPAAGRDGAPLVAVVVPSRLERVRLLWLLDALAEQDLPIDAVEVLIGTDAAGGASVPTGGVPAPGGAPAAPAGGAPEGRAAGRYRAPVLEHPLLAEGRARLVAAPAPATTGAVRNAAWRAAAAPLIAFCDDDTRPPPTWLPALLAAARAAPGAVVQGAVRIDEDERLVADLAPHRHLLEVAPPTVWGETANVLYPRAVLERLGGFDPSWAVCEDTDLACRARRAGVAWVAAPEAWTRHGVHEETLRGALHRARRYGAVGRLVAVHPELRAAMPGRVFWTHPHARLVGLLAGSAAAALRRRPAAAGAVARGAAAPLAGSAAAALRRRPAAAAAVAGAAAAPYVAWRLGRYGRGPRGRLRAALETPAGFVLDLVEVAAVAGTAARHRTVLL